MFKIATKTIKPDPRSNLGLKIGLNNSLTHPDNRATAGCPYIPDS